ncbi:MAG: hypothetical protein OEM38_02880 [Gammaproteobacteria bacterium]|nr:hypothetical protein [Gammaproteobacteria bacterium]
MGKTQREDAVKRASSMRDKAMAIAMKRKEEYLGARVPKALKERVINRADEMNVPVSLLIRRLLEESFPEDGANSSKVSLGISGGVDSTFLDLAPVNAKASVIEKEIDKYAGIIGWKQIEVNQDRSCERCKEPLPRGSQVSLGFTSSDAGYVIVCQQCKSQLV